MWGWTRWAGPSSGALLIEQRVMPLFKKKDPKEQLREWKSQLRKEQRVIQRQINGIKREEAKVEKSLKDAAKAGDKDVALILAKEVLQSRKTVSKMYASIAQINSVMMNMDHQLATVRMAGAMEKSTDVMKAMQSLMKVGEVRETMMALSKEMNKAGLIGEMMDDTFESLEDDDLEEEAGEAVEAILFEVTKGQLGKAPVVSKQPEGAVAQDVEVEDEDDEEEMRQRLAALNS